MKNIPQAYRPSYLWFWPPLILGGSVISAVTIHDLRRVKVPGTGPLWNPWERSSLLSGQLSKVQRQSNTTELSPPSREIIPLIRPAFKSTETVKYYWIVPPSREIIPLIRAAFKSTETVKYYWIVPPSREIIPLIRPQQYRDSQILQNCPPI
jgi:hypothetical protein